MIPQHQRMAFSQRKARFLARPRSLLLTILSSLALAYLVFYAYFRAVHWGPNGRWDWNWSIAKHPALAYILPKGDWGPIENPPRYVQGVIDAPWMGDWGLPQLTKPKYENGTSHRHLVSTALIKIYVFSVPQEKYRHRRELIRRISPLLNIPHRLRHLVDVKFLVGHSQDEEDKFLDEEQAEFGDIVRLEGLKNGENLREGKILRWIQATVDTGRPSWWMFKVDDDAVFNLPKLLDVLMSLDVRQPIYTGTSLNRWPAYHFHFTGAVTGFNYGVAKSLAHGIHTMSKEDIEASWDDDVLTGEMMYTLPSGPQCRENNANPLPKYCNPKEPPPWGYDPPPPSPDPRTGLIRHDLLDRVGDWYVPWIRGDIGFHGCKDLYGYEKEWTDRVKGHMWTPPAWMEAYSDE